MSFRTKPRLAQEMLAAGREFPLPGLLGMRSTAATAAADVAGAERDVPRAGHQEQRQLWVWPEKGPRQVRADRLAALVDASHWQRRSAGDGAKGPRVYDWARVELRPLKEPGKGYWLLARRSVTKPGELAYYVCFGRRNHPGGTGEGWRTLGHRGML